MTLVTLSVFVILALPTITDPISGTKQIINKDGISNWSSASDIMSAIIGIPVALAGSLVAIYIAHRAYIISQNQADFESMTFIESLCERSADTYWELCAALQALDTMMSELPSNVLYYKRPVITTYGITPENEAQLPDAHRWALQQDREAKQAINLARSVFKDHISACSIAILRVLRDPLSSKSWEVTQNQTNWTTEAINVVPSDVQWVGAALAHGEELKNRHPAHLAQIIRHALNQSEVLGQNTVDCARAAFIQSRFSKKCETKINISHKYYFRASKLLDKKFDGTPLRKAKNDPLGRLLAAGAMLQTAHFVHPTTKDRMGFNIGAVYLAAVIQQIPTRDSQINAMNDYLDENIHVSRAARKRSINAILSKNIQGYALPSLQDAALEISKNPSLLIFYAGDAQGGNGYKVHLPPEERDEPKQYI